jgi:hypothetical protein
VFFYDDAFLKHNVNEIFERAVGLVRTLCPTGKVTLRIPAFGTNNGVSYFDSACTIAYGLHECALSIVQDAVVTKFEVVSPADLPSSRVIAHVGNCMRALVRGVNVGDLCDVCTLRNKSVIFGKCGHRTMCMQCARAMHDRGSEASKCPLCRCSVELQDMLCVPCITKAESNVCSACGSTVLTTESSDSGAFVPCGHYRVVCKNDHCARMASESGVCLVCKSYAKYIKVFV